MSRRRSGLKVALAIGVSLLLLWLLYRQVDPAQLLAALRRASLPLFLAALGVGGLLSAATAWRYAHFARRLGITPAPGYGTSLKSYFLAACLNLVLPSKLGDLGKGLLCSRLDRIAYPFELHVFTVYEKVADLFSLVLLGALLGLLRRLVGAVPGIPELAGPLAGLGLTPLLLLLALPLLLVLLPHRHGGVVARLLKPLPLKLREAGLVAGRFRWADFLVFLLVSLGLWSLHLVQMGLFAQALAMDLWSASGLLVMVTAVLVGLLPLSFAGIGTRDAVLLLLLGPLYGTAQPLLFGVLLTSRYVLPALVGAFLLRELAEPS
ncbi:lysylphosphatidylglycerol synthase transmembrane domain-containing protein [Vulcanococcus limneticus]|uniref:lysylphosphatidylglycerol synthase transmembrane domain-containing protein n=1 Tax=Vulcanococcus limneticus TaxID=2170428 RepID=UPI00398BDBA9